MLSNGYLGTYRVLLERIWVSPWINMCWLVHYVEMAGDVDFKRSTLGDSKSLLRDI